jgi:uncharacterized protein (DUF1800 family)
MANDPRDVLVALNRFGLGARPGDPARIAGDPRGSVEEQLSRHDAALLTADGLQPSDQAYRLNRMSEMQRERERSRVAMLGNAVPSPGTAAMARPAGNAMGGDMAGDMAGGDMMGNAAPKPAVGKAANGNAANGMGGAAIPSDAKPSDTKLSNANPPSANPSNTRPPNAGPGEQPLEQQLLRAEVGARFARQAGTDAGLVERLVNFWSNHFAVSVAKGNNLRVLAGPYEREAIRPHVLGRFADMLKAVETHPAMLFYLDNNQSIGPMSRNGINSKRGLNENLTREILELHTLGADGGYSQADVTSFARVITGWTVTSPDEDSLYGGKFTFGPARHEPGEHAVLTKVYAEGGVDQGHSVLEDLARHPSTARHIARKLVAHFVADVPPPPLVDKVAKVYRDTDGQLAEVVRAIVEAPEAWAAPLAKLRSPQDFVIAGYRATGKLPEPNAIMGALNALGQPLWQPPGPNGWGDTEGAWASPEGLSARLDLASQWGRQNGGINPKDLVDQIVGPAASSETRQAVARAESRQQGLAILFMSPEFQRR